ncbi:hypothetical protein [Spirosoma telluris]
MGIDARNGTLQRAFLKEYEASQSRRVTQLTEASNNYLSWTWSNTLTYQKKFAQLHDIKVLLGTEAIKNTGRGLFGAKSNYDFESTNFLSLNTGLPQSLGDVSANDADINRNTLLFSNSLFSYFGRLDYILRTSICSMLPFGGMVHRSLDLMYAMPIFRLSASVGGFPTKPS